MACSVKPCCGDGCAGVATIEAITLHSQGTQDTGVANRHTGTARLWTAPASTSTPHLYTKILNHAKLYTEQLFLKAVYFTYLPSTTIYSKQLQQTALHCKVLPFTAHSWFTTVVDGTELGPVTLFNSSHWNMKIKKMKGPRRQCAVCILKCAVLSLQSALGQQEFYRGWFIHVNCGSSTGPLGPVIGTLCTIALHCTALHCTALHCTALHCTALHCTALHCTALHCTDTA